MMMDSRKEKLKTTAQKFFGFPLLCVALLISGAAKAASSPYPLVQTTQHAGLIFSGHKDYANYELVVGKMEYVEDADSEGFKPTQKQALVGSIDRRLYDYPKQKSALQIYENTLASLKRQHYRIVYQCSGETCGGAAGWRLFLSDKLGGDTGFQHYVVAIQGSASGASQYVVLYVNDLAGQPRALVDVITVSALAQSGDASGAVMAATPTTRNDDATKASIYFELGQSALMDRTEQLARAKQFVESHRNQCPIHVIGYTDAMGGEASNHALAKARVEAVMHYLHEIKELSPTCLVPDPRGVEVAATGERPQSRRVDLALATND